MKTAIVYFSTHHGNTKKLVEAIAEKNEVTLIDVTSDKKVDLTEFDRIGFASGIYFSSFSKQILSFAEENLPEGKEVFFINTCGNPVGIYFNAIRKITEKKNCKELISASVMIPLVLSNWLEGLRRAIPRKPRSREQ